MRGIRCLVAALLAAGMVTVVAAQPGRQPGNFGGGQDAFSLVLTNSVLQEEVKVTDDQKKDFKVIAEEQTELNKKVSEKYGRDAFKDAAGDKDKIKELIEAGGKERAKVRETIRKKTESKLTDAQKKRLKQINVQLMGVNVFADPEAKMGGGGMFGGFGFSDSQKATIKEVGDTLKLTDTQKTKIKSLVEEYEKDRAAVRKDIFGEKVGKGGFDQEKQKEFRTKSNKLQTETMGKINEALDDTQKTAWKGLVGDAFDTSKLFQQPKKD